MGEATRAVTVRRAVAGEAAALSALCRRSKAHWGYDDAFMALCADTLTVSQTAIAEGRVMVAEDERGVAVGVAAVDVAPAPPDLDLFFVAPEAMGRGVGQRLMTAVVADLRTRGYETLEILSDPHAEAFYRGIGAVRVGAAPSDAIPGRRLPRLRLSL